MSFIKAVLALVVATLFSTVATAQTAACTASPEIACTEQGAVRGVVQGATMAFKGIPYAAPPVGSLRWKPPEAGSTMGSDTRRQPLSEQCVRKSLEAR